MKKRILSLIDDINGNNILTGFTSHTEGPENPEEVANEFQKFNLIPNDEILDFYVNIKNLKIDWLLNEAQANIDYIDEEMDIVSGACIVPSIVESREKFNFINHYIIDYTEDRYMVALPIEKNEILNKIFFNESGSEEWIDLNLTLTEYLNKLIDNRCFLDWQLGMKYDDITENIDHYLAQLFPSNKNNK